MKNSRTPFHVILIVACSAALAMMLAPQIAQAAACTTNGAGTNWNTGANWDCGHAPGTGDSATVAHDMILNDYWWAKDVTVNSGITLTLKKGFHVESSFSVNGTLALDDGGYVDTSGSPAGLKPTYGSSSTLTYVKPGTYNISDEWGSGTSGAGVPYNVEIATGSTLDLVDAASVARTAQGNVTISGTLVLGNDSGEDLNVGGNWSNSGTFTPNGRAVFFNGAGTQTITKSGGETFNYLVIDKSAGSLQFSDNVTVNASSGNVLQLLNSGGIDLNGKTLTLANDGGNLLVSGGVRTITGSAGSTVDFTGSKTVSATSSGTLVFDTNVLVKISKGVNFGSSLSTINGTLQIEANGWVNTNAPTYGSASTLKYNTGGSYSVATEWGTGTSGPGVPANVQVSNSSTNVSLGGGVTRTATGNITIDANTTLTLASSSDKIYVKGNWTNNNGSSGFVHNSGTVRFNGTSTQTLVGDTTFCNVERVDATGSTFDWGNGTTTTIAGTFTVESGTQNAGSGTTVIFTGACGAGPHEIGGGSNAKRFVHITLASGTLQHTGAGNINVTGNWINNGATFDGSTRTVAFNGSTEQTIGGTSSTTFNNLTLSNSAGASLGNSQTVNGTLTLSNGRVTLNGYDFTFGASASLSGTPGSSKMLATNGTGKACKVFSTTGSFTLPIGETTGTAEYSPAAFSVTAGSGTACARVVDADHPNRTTGISDYITRYWVVSGSGSPTYDPTFTFLAADVVGSTGNMHGKKWNGSYPWQELSAATATTFSGAGLTSFSDFTAFKSGQLAVLLELFEAEAASNHVLVTWETVNERENLGFHLYRGPASEGPWTRLNDSLIPSQSPGSPWGYRYSFQDFAAAWGEPAFYRVDAVDFQDRSQPLGITGVALGSGVRLWLPLLAR